MANTPKKRNRSDSVLNTGMTSAAERRVRAKQEELHNKNQEASRQFTVGGEGVLEWIDQERAAVLEDLAKLPMNVETTDKHVKSELRAFQMHLNFLTRFKTKAKIQMRIAERNDRKAAKAWLKQIEKGEDDAK